MTLAKVTSKGQVTIPLEIRQKLGLEAGSRIDFILTGEGRVVVEPVHSSVKSLEGVFHNAGRKPVSLAEMQDAIEEEAGRAGHARPEPGATT
ncbi:AbrB/MazE/SpoVT family DNA-binding domain-containing protein [uncultured Arthrobacter sp.]|uniref:AbrB/MazE/SpoVT family DNA-binding domain-containing protein n=1 Tax=uncultured Arthrobacter sp. TaxID=114050 RepID=UPI0026395FD4|nr:AbrB/MazE/SpoVT family DNA-binding domain-containing protein [uncultured Arthrobacter sp.]